MSRREFIIIVIVVLCLCTLYIAINTGHATSTDPKMLWGRFQIMHDSQVNRLISDPPEKTKPVYYMYKWIIARG
jgi:hypothetical protein